MNTYQTESLEKYSTEEFSELIFTILEEIARKCPEKIKASWTELSPDHAERGMLDYILAYEHENCIIEGHEHMTVIAHDCRVPYCTKDGCRPLEDVISDLKKEEGLEIIVCVQILRQVGRELYVAKLLNKVFLVRIPFSQRLNEESHVFLIARHDIEPRKVSTEFFKISRKKALSMIV